MVSPTFPRISTQPIRHNLLQKRSGGGCHSFLLIPVVVPPYRHVASTYPLCLPLLEKTRGCGGILLILELLAPPRHSDAKFPSRGGLQDVPTLQRANGPYSTRYIVIPLNIFG